MKLALAVIPFAMMTTAPDNASTIDGCVIRLSENGSYINLQGVVDAAGWSKGTYDMTIETRQGGNRSLSRQSGNFDATAQIDESLLVLSASTIYISTGGRLIVRLNVDDGIRNTSCELHYER